jgi:hypothetical protein
MSSSERALLVARVLEVHPHLAELVPLRLLTRPALLSAHPNRGEGDQLGWAANRGRESL